MQTLTHNKPMNTDPSGRILLISSYLLDIGALLSDLHPIAKGVLVFVTVLTTIMAFFNQYKTFQKNFRTWYIVVTVNRVITFIKPKKNRHRGITITKKKIEE